MRVHLGLGSNMGDRMSNLAAAVAAIGRLSDTVVVAVSHAYESEAWPDACDPLYANAVAIVDTALALPALLAELRDIEAALGRPHDEARNAPRAIDIDILLAGDEEWDRPDLVVPHPRMRERDFVITPLLEVSPHLTWPDGTAVTRDDVRVGRVTATLGALGGTSTADTEWVEIKRFSGRANYDVNLASDIAFATSMLSSAGIPFALDPPPGAEGAGPYPFPISSRLLVPALRENEAREFLAGASSASFDFTDAYRMAKENPAESDLLDESDE